MSEEEQVDLDIKSEQAKFKNKKKLRKRKSKTTCEDEDDSVVKVQHKSKKMKVEPALNNSLLKWLNKSVDKSQTSPTEVLQSKNQRNNINKSSIDKGVENIEVNPISSVSTNESTHIDYQDSTNTSSKASVNELLSKIDFSNLKAKLNSKLSLSPKGCPTNKTQNPIESTGSSPIVNGKSKKNKLPSKKKKTTSDDNLSHSQITPVGNKTKNKSKDGVESKSIEQMFETVKHRKSENIEVNGKNSTSKEDSEIESDENSQFFDDTFLDSDDSGMIFISNKYERRKFVDTESDSFVRTPVKESELMAPPYSPLSPLCRKSPRATRSPSLRSLKDSPLKKSPGPIKSPLPLLSSSPWKKNILIKSPKMSKHQSGKSTSEITDVAALQLPQPCRDNSCMEIEEEKSPKVSKKLFETPTVLPCEPIKESILEKKHESIEFQEHIETVESKISKKKHKKSLKMNDSIDPNSQINAETHINESVSDEDFKTPKKKTKSEKKKKIKTNDQQLQLEEVPKNSKSKKKESPNLNSSLLNYFKRVEKEVDKSSDDNVPDTTENSVKTEPVNISTDDTKINEGAVKSSEKKKHKKKSKKRKRSSCVEIRFDFESDDSKDQDIDVESKKKEKNCKVRRKSDKKEKIQAPEEQEVQVNEAIIEKSEFKNKNDEEENQETIDRNESINFLEKKEIAVKKKKKRKNKNDESVVEQQIEIKETNKDFELDIKADENEKHNVEANEAEDCTKILPNEIENKYSKTKEIEAVTKNEPETKKKRSRGRPKKEAIVKTSINEPVEETDKSVKKETNEDSKVDYDDKENLIRIQENKGKSKEKKELQEHCDNVNKEEIDGGENKIEKTASLFKYFKKVDSLVHEDKNSSSNVLKVEAQVHTPPTTPSKWKRKSVPSPVPPPKPAPDESSGGGSRRKSSRISEKRQKEETQRMEDEIVVLEEEEKRSKGSKCKRKISDDSDDEIFVVKEKKKSNMLSPAPQSKVKLASIFTKKAKLSKSETEARQKFLQSGVPEAIRRQTELLRKQEEILEELEYYSFPVINHVTQTLVTPRRSGAISVHPLDLGRFKLYPDGGDNEGLAQNKTEIFSNKLQNINDGALTRDDPRDQNGLMLNHSDRDWNSLVQSEEKEKVKAEEWTRPTNVNKALSVLKKRVPSIEETSVFKQVAKSLTSTPPEERETEDSPLLLWSEKYKPESERDILGNRSSVDTLRSWLEARKKVQRRPLYSSSDEESDFMDDTNSSSQFSRKQNTAVLTGPPGCGKTCAVYALASQLGFKVIELNASCNRNGKRILSDLSEATQSHQVSHQSQAAGQITSFFGTKLNGPALFGTKPSGLTPNGTTIPDVVDLFDSSLEEKVEVKSTAKSKRKRKRKEDDVEKEDSDSAIKRPGKKERKSAGKLTNGKEKKSLEKQKNYGKKIGKGGNVKVLESGSTQNSVQNTLSIGKSTTNVGKTFSSVGKSTESDPSDREKEDAGKSMSIILIEDADIIFSDYDEGFVAALSSLVATSKRPLILVSNEERVGHLSKLMRGGSSLVLHFETPLYAEIGCFLQLVSVLEGIKLSQDKSLLLVQHNRGDIRKCLLALQFYILSRSSYPSHPHPPWCASSSSQLTSLWWLWSSHYKLPPLIHNHTRAVLTRADPLLHETHEIGENSFTNPRQTSVREPVRRNESRPGSVEDERIEESKYLDNDERKVSQENGVSKDETMEKELVDGSGVSVKPGKDSQESGYGSASSQQNPEPCQENQQSSQENQQLNQKNQQISQKKQQSSQENQQSNQKKNQQSSQENQQSSQENQQLNQENQQLNQQNQQSSQQNQQLSQENQQSSQNNQKISHQEPGHPNQETNSSTGRGMDGNVASLKAKFSRRFESWAQFQTEKSNMSQLSSMLSCFSQVDLMHRKLNLVSPGRDENPVPQIWQCRPNASSSLDNDVTSSLNATHDVTTRDLCASLLSCGRGLLPVSVEAASTPGVNGPYEETRRHTQQAFSLQRSLLSSFSPAEALSRRGFPLDHYTGLRSLARSETARHAASSKRYSRFFSHLKSVNIHLSQSDTDRLCQVLWLR